MTTRLKKLGADRLRVLKALAAGGRVEKRRAYPFAPTFHLKRFEVVEAPPKVTELVMADLITAGLIAPSTPVDLTTPSGADTIDYVITPAGHRAVQRKGLEYDDPQVGLLDDDAGRYPAHPITSMEAA